MCPVQNKIIEILGDIKNNKNQLYKYILKITWNGIYFKKNKVKKQENKQKLPKMTK